MSKLPSYIINTDGGSRGNPGQAASGYIIKSAEDKVIFQNAVCLGIATNNEAEYMAIKLALKCLSESPFSQLPADVEVRTDSQLVARQLSGLYKIKHPQLKVFFDEIKKIEIKIGSVRYVHIPREENSLADKLVNIALDNNRR